MIADNASAWPRVTPRLGGDTGLRKDGTQKFPMVEFTHPSGIRVSRILTALALRVL